MNTQLTTLSPGLASEYKRNISYKVGDYILHQNAYWRCISAHTGGDWDNSKWMKDENPITSIYQTIPTETPTVVSTVISPSPIDNLNNVSPDDSATISTTFTYNVQQASYLRGTLQDWGFPANQLVRPKKVTLFRSWKTPGNSKALWLRILALDSTTNTFKVAYQAKNSVVYTNYDDSQRIDHEMECVSPEFPFLNTTTHSVILCYVESPSAPTTECEYFSIRRANTNVGWGILITDTEEIGAPGSSVTYLPLILFTYEDRYTLEKINTQISVLEESQEDTQDRVTALKESQASTQGRVTTLEENKRDYIDLSYDSRGFPTANGGYFQIYKEATLLDTLNLSGVATFTGQSYVVRQYSVADTSITYQVIARESNNSVFATVLASENYSATFTLDDIDLNLIAFSNSDSLVLKSEIDTSFVKKTEAWLVGGTAEQNTAVGAKLGGLRIDGAVKNGTGEIRVFSFNESTGEEARYEKDKIRFLAVSNGMEYKNLSATLPDIINTANGENTAYGKSIETTYENLARLCNDGELVPGRQYQITDYVTLVGENSGYSSAELTFNLIVTADTASTLNHRAKAVRAMEYSVLKADFDKWEVWYDVKNDTGKYPWAATNAEGGKGVIYRLIDEYNNDLPYDFKNIKYNDTFTFTYTLEDEFGTSFIEGSSTGNFYNISVQRLKNGVLPWNTFTGSCYGITLEHTCVDNTFNNASNITLKANCLANTISGDNIYLGYACYQNEITGSIITLAGNCDGNKVGGSSYNISFGLGCKYVILGVADGSTLYPAHNITIYPGVNTLSFTGLPEGKEMQNVEIRSGIYNKTVAITSDNKLYSDSLAVLRPTTVTTTVA